MLELTVAITADLVRVLAADPGEVVHYDLANTHMHARSHLHRREFTAQLKIALGFPG
jgi:hypothetical protein